MPTFRAISVAKRPTVRVTFGHGASRKAFDSP
jgi:hypothetical protein